MGAVIKPRYLPIGGKRDLAYQFGVVFQLARTIEERAEISKKLLESKTTPREDLDRAHRLLRDAMALHAAAERAVKIADLLT